MKVRFVGHASIFIERQNYAILCDPWFEGKVFNNSWALVSPANPPAYSAVNCIWISHEHPDHFNFSTLKAIPDADKARIKVLYQRHASPRIVEAMRKMGFSQIIELPLYKWFRLEPDLEIFCGSVGSMDSFIAVRDGKECILNLNDCVLNVDQLRYIKRQVGRVSVLFAQFSFASWVGNERDETHEAERMIKQLVNEIEIFHPEFTVPTASFVYFCNEENCRMNSWMNTPDAIAQLHLKGVNFMYPGDVWDADTRTFNSEAALEKYRADYANIRIDSTPAAMDIAQVSQAIKTRLQETRTKVPRLLLKRIQPFTLYIHDLDVIVEVDPAQGVHRVFKGDERQKQAARYVMCSQVAWFMFAFSWGADTTHVSGMYIDREFAKSGPHPFFRMHRALSTEVFRFAGVKSTLRTVNFWWGKKQEIVFRFTAALRGQGVSVD